jgi:hypothetical protein
LPQDTRARSWRFRAGVVQTFGSLILLVFVLFVLLGPGLLYDAFAHPFAADSGQVIMGSVCPTFSLSLIALILHHRPNQPHQARGIAGRYFSSRTRR